MLDMVISARDVHKTYGGHEAVAGVDLNVRSGEIFAFLGPNGAGKTTTVEILEGYREATSGEVCVLGRDPRQADRAWRHRVGIVLQESQPEAELTARECLQMYAGYYARPRPVEATLALVGLTEQAAMRISSLSGGQRRRLDVGLGLIGDPDLLFLDEPTTGFDPSARHTAWAMIAGLRELGKTIFLTTHYMDEAEALADRIAIIVDGRIIAEGTPETLGGRDQAASRITFSLPSDAAVDTLPAMVRQSMIESSESYVSLSTSSPAPVLHELSAWALERGYDLVDIDVRRPSLEDIYLKLTRETP
jgi:ABC-2 type transport system ATP-binding protein